MKKIAILALILGLIAPCLGVLAPCYATNPNDHTSMLLDNDQRLQKKMKKRVIAEDEEDVYYIISGEADKAIEAEDYHTAVLRLKEAIELEPENPSNVLLLSNLGMVYSYLDQDTLALKAYNEALDKAPSMVTVLENRAKLHLKMGNDLNAYQDFANVIQRDSLNTEARYYHGLMSLYKGDSGAAERDFNIIKKQEPKGYYTAVALSTLYSFSGKDSEAVPYYKRVLEMDKAPEFYAGLAGCYLKLGQLSDASQTISEGLQECGDDPELYYYRAWLKRDSYLLDEAKADAAKAVQLGADPRKVAMLFRKK